MIRPLYARDRARGDAVHHDRDDLLGEHRRHCQMPEEHSVVDRGGEHVEDEGDVDVGPDVAALDASPQRGFA